ncbi:Hypothetical predicted protein [Podarcis lilfordi]|uniref:Uncharacterized protein n=1 Tax=Podarcis lilfordi TaxID=74358 RepID=A0AA35KKU4_9SAUR|nr:Hypothetical predicted protein [Podarcis lilfordi]
MHYLLIKQFNVILYRSLRNGPNIKESPPHPSLFSPHRLTIKPTDVRNKRSCFPPPIYSNTLHPFENGNTVVVIYFMGSPPTDVGVIAPHSFLE